MEDHTLEPDKDEIVQLYFKLLNPYKEEPFDLRRINRPVHYSPHTEAALVFQLPSPTKSIPLSASPPTQRSLHGSSLPGSAPSSPRGRSDSGNLVQATRTASISLPRDSSSSPPIPPRGGKSESISPRNHTRISKEPDLSNRSSTTLTSLSSPRQSTSLGRSVGKVVNLPLNRERSRTSSMIDSPKPKRGSDEEQDTKDASIGDENEGVLKRFFPEKPTFSQRLKYNVVSGLNQHKAEKSKFKKKGSFKDGLSSVRNSRAATPTHSINSSPTLSGKKGNELEFGYWNEIIEGSNLFLGMQPKKSNHPFLIDNPDYDVQVLHSKRYLLNPALFPALHNEDGQIVGIVFTFQDPFEMTGGYVNKDTKLDHNDFHQLRVLNKCLPIPDETCDVHVVLALYRLFDMMENYLRGLPIYLHCTSGKGRSATFMILLLAFCFLLERRVAFNRAYLNLYMDGVDSDQLFQYKRTLLCKIVERITRAKGGNELIEAFAEELPNEVLLRKLFETCEDVVKKDRAIKLGENQRISGVKILTKLVEGLYSSVVISHPNSKVPNHAFIDNVTQTRVLKDIHFYMDNLDKKDIGCKSFQEFLLRMAYNLDGWYEELVYAIEGNNHIESECGYFTKTSDADDRAKRMEFLAQFRTEVESLFEKYPECDYAKSYNAKKKTNYDKREYVITTKEVGRSEPRSLTSSTRLSPRVTSSGQLTSPRVRSIVFAKEISKKASEIPEDPEMRERSRTFDRTNIPVPIGTTITSPRFLGSGHSSPPRGNADDSSRAGQSPRGRDSSSCSSDLDSNDEEESSSNSPN